MSLQTMSAWLRCPNCFARLSAREPLALFCANGHGFDVNKRGFVNLVTGSRKLTFDSPTMLDARHAFLEAGWFSDLRAALAATAANLSPATVIDIGCGTGYYLRGVKEAIPDASFLAVDLSPAAVARAVRNPRGDGGGGINTGRIDGLVADVWSPLPIKDQCADLVLNVFAPRNASEFHRILRPGGSLVVVIPQEEHLQELRALGLALDVQPDKHRHLVDALAAHFRLVSSTQHSSVMSLTPIDVAALIAMGPSSHHRTSGSSEGASMTHSDVTASFEILSFTRLGR